MKKYIQPLTDEQADGVACIVCNRSDRPQVPIDAVEPTHGGQLFRCECCELATKQSVN